MRPRYVPQRGINLDFLMWLLTRISGLGIVVLALVGVVDLRISPSKGFWEILLESGGRKGLVYVDFSKKYLISGRMISIKERRDLTKESFAQLNRIDVSQIPLDDALVMGDQQARIRVIVFHDPD